MHASPQAVYPCAESRPHRRCGAFRLALLALAALGVFALTACESDSPDTDATADVTDDTVADDTAADAAGDTTTGGTDTTTEGDAGDAGDAEDADTSAPPHASCDPGATPPVLCAQDGLLAFDLQVAYGPQPDIPVWRKPGKGTGAAVPGCNINDTYQTLETLQLRTYGVKQADGTFRHGIPGPTLRLGVEDKLEIAFSNAISGDTGWETRSDTDMCVKNGPPDDVAPNCFHGLDTTNIHYHGTHTDPDDNHDNVFLAFAPGESIDYEIEFSNPTDPSTPIRQVPGTHWYHAHKHGSTALHMLNGLAGALIIEGDFAGIAEVEAAEERVLVLQEIDDQVNQLATGEQKKTAAHNPTLVNGELTPEIVMRPGEVQRWRFISATQRAAASISDLRLRLEDATELGPIAPGACSPAGPAPAYDYDAPGMYQIAQDGVEFLDDQWQHVLCRKGDFLDIGLAPGNRADYLVRAPDTEGLLALHVVKEFSGSTAEDGVTPGDTCTPPAEWGTRVENPQSPQLLRIRVEGDPKPMSVPKNLRTLDDLPQGMREALAPIDGADVTIDATQTVSFAMNPGPPNSPQFSIDCKKFCSARVDHCMVLNTTEEWRIYNFTNVNHPFHIHINPFFVTDYFDAAAWYEAKAPGGDPLHPFVAGTPPPVDAGLLAAGDPRRRWQDTIALPSAFVPPPDPATGALPAVVPGHITIRHRFLDFTGDYVIHCHILGHEDRGMMQRIGVRETAGDCQAALSAPNDCAEGVNPICQACTVDAMYATDLPAACKNNVPPSQMWCSSPDQSGCGGKCFDLDTDPAHCGMCGHKCDAATPTCKDGVCE